MFNNTLLCNTSLCNTSLCNTSLCTIFLIILLLIFIVVTSYVLGKKLFSCTPSCDDKECGDDGCEGSCGKCDLGYTCQDGKCISVCIPSCGDNECGSDGCRGSCGTCDSGKECKNGKCIDVCTPSCDDKECGDDGCGGSCGTCEDGYTCQDGKCISTCTPSCDDKQCGDDGCGGSCGTCPANVSTCQDGYCIITCTPTCNINECGDDGCGGSCECQDGYTCQDGKCISTCTPSCDDKQCGDDGCGGSCGTCPANVSTCQDGYCIITCTPTCDINDCGDDGCGGSCGTCEYGYYCERGECVNCDNVMEHDPSITVYESDTTYISGSSVSFDVSWSVDCTDVKGHYIPGCPDNFRYSITVRNSSNNDQYKFDNLTVYGEAIDGDYTGKLLEDPPFQFTLSIIPMLPVGTYDATVKMSRTYYSCTQEVSVMGNNIATVESSAVTDVNADESAYGFSDLVKCSWSKTSGTTNYTHNISILDKDMNTVKNSRCVGVEGDSFTYKVYKFNPTSDLNCSGSSYGVQLLSGSKYYINIVSCDENGYCDDGVVSDDSFSVVECIISSSGVDKGNCIISNSETNLLDTDSHARMIYELQCSYADDVENCMDQYYPGRNFDGREISSVCLPMSDGSENVCSREVCPPMSVPYTDKSSGKKYAGCTTPYNDQYPNPPANSYFQSGSYFSYKGEDAKILSGAAGYSSPYSEDPYKFEYGYPFVAIIEGGSNKDQSPVFTNAYEIELSDTSQMIAVPGMTGYDDNIYVMPFPIQNFHPFMAWITFSQIDDDSNPTGGAKTMSYANGDCSGYGFNLYHIGSSTYLNNSTSVCHVASNDSGKLCTPHMITLTDNINHYTDENGVKITCNKQPSADSSARNPCFTSNIWLDKKDARFPDRKDVDIEDTAPIISSGSCNDGGFPEYSKASNNWNAPVKNGKPRQGMIFFGSDTKDIGTLYHRDTDNNKISHMRRWVINQNNSYFWSDGLGSAMSKNGIGGSNGVYTVLAQQWPNGPPYSSFYKRPLDIKFSAPIQYGISQNNSQTNFVLEAYTWNDSYNGYEGRGFLSSNTNQGTSSNIKFYLVDYDDISADTVITWKNDEGKNQNGDITMIEAINILGGYGGYYMNMNLAEIVGMECNYYEFSVGETNGTVQYLPSGYITFTPYTMYFGCTPVCFLCVDNTDNSLWWININDRTYTNDFTPLMLAMSWKS